VNILSFDSFTKRWNLCACASVSSELRTVHLTFFILTSVLNPKTEG